jgi:choline monooxygenase
MDAAADRADELIAALERGESLPARWYTDASIVDAEIARIFRRSWIYAGPLERLRAVGDYLTTTVGDVPVIVVRNESGLAAFVNVCRHRRHIVMRDCGRATALQCGYHAWTYDLAGRLTGAPRSAHEPDFALADYPLLPVRVETLGPWAFVNLDRDARPLRSQFAPVLDAIATSGVDVHALQLYRSESWDARANWKTMLENFLECYHCAIAHPRFSATIDVKPDRYRLTWDGWYCTQRGPLRRSPADGEVVEAQFYLLWPNVTLSINPGFPNVAIDVWYPDGPNRTTGFTRTFFAPGVAPQVAEELIAFNAEVGAEDDALTDSVQRGLLGGRPDRGRFMRVAEELPLTFQKFVAAALGGDDALLERLADRNTSC